MEAIELDESTVNPPNVRVGPQDFQLLKVLGKGGYGKVHLPPRLAIRVCRSFKCARPADRIKARSSR